MQRNGGDRSKSGAGRPGRTRMASAMEPAVPAGSDYPSPRGILGPGDSMPRR